MMAVSTQSTGLAGMLTALRGVMMFVAGLFALIYPVQALRLLVFVGGGILLVDGILNLAATNLQAPRDALFWVRIARCILAMLAGLAVLLSPWLSGLLSRGFLIYFVGIQAVLVGVVEAYTALMPGQAGKRSLWMTLASGGLYALFGLALIFLSLGSATFLTQIVGVLMLVYGAILMSRLWR